MTMLTREGCIQRREALRRRLPDCGLLIVSQPQHVFYLSGFLANSTELAGWGVHFLLIDRDGHTRLVTDNWNSAAAQAAFVDAAFIWPWYDFSQPAEEKLAAGAAALAGVLSRHYPSRRRVAIDAAHLPAAAQAALDLEDVDDLGPVLGEMRRAKYPDELDAIRRAIRAAEAGHAAAREYLRPGLTELELYGEVTRAIILAAGAPVVMLGDFAGGRRSESGGGPPTGNVLQEGELVILDLFPLIAGYRADITNTLCVGPPAQDQLDLIQVLQDAMRSAEAVLGPGILGGEVYAACREPLKEAGLAEAFFHHAGHGLGLGHPEPPYLVPGSQEALRVGDVITLEPGAYRPGWGGARIEHDYVITTDGFERLSQHHIGL